MLEKNRATREPASTGRLRRVHEARQRSKRASERAIAAAHERASGPAFTTSMERQPAHRAPKIKLPGS